MEDRFLVQAESLLLLVAGLFKLGRDLFLLRCDLRLKHLISSLLLQLSLFLNLDLFFDEALKIALVHLMLQVRNWAQVILRVDYLSRLLY